MWDPIASEFLGISAPEFVNLPHDDRAVVQFGILDKPVNVIMYIRNNPTDYPRFVIKSVELCDTNTNTNTNTNTDPPVD